MNSFVLLVYFLTIPAFYYIFKKPDEIYSSTKQKSVAGIIVVLYTLFAFLPSFQGTNSMYRFGFIAYPLLYAVFLKRYIRKIVKHLLNKTLFVLILIFILLWIEELILAFTHVADGSYREGLNSVAKHLAGYFGFYFGMASTIVFFYRRWDYSLWQIFTVGGIWGIIIEQEFLMFRLLFSSNIFSLIVFISFVFPTYGLFLAAPKLLFHEEFKNVKKPKKWQPILLFLGIFILPLISWWLWNTFFTVVGIDISGII